MEPLTLALLWLPLSALHSRGLPLLSFVTMTSSSPLCSLLDRPGQQEHHCCWFCSGIRMFILFSGSPRLLRQSGCQSAPRALEFGPKPSLSGASALPLPAQAGSARGNTDLSSSAQGRECQTGVSASSSLKNSGFSLTFSSGGKSVQCFPLSRSMVFSELHYAEWAQFLGFFPTVLLWQSLPFPHSNRTFSWAPWPPRITFYFSISLAGKCNVNSSIEICAGLGYAASRTRAWTSLLAFFLLAGVGQDGWS